LGRTSTIGGGSDSGHVRVYTYQAERGWTQIGDDIDGEKAGDWAGAEVAISMDGTIVAVGTPQLDIDTRTEYGNGSVRVYNFTDGLGWVQLIVVLFAYSACRMTVNGYSWETILTVRQLAICLGLERRFLPTAELWQREQAKTTEMAITVAMFECIISSPKRAGCRLEKTLAAGDLFGWHVKLSEDGTILGVGGYRSAMLECLPSNLYAYQML